MRNSTLTSDVDGSDVLDHGVRAGLIAYGIVHLVVAWMGVQLALGDSGGKASQTGALQQLAENGAGRLSLYAAALGFAALVIWQGAEAVVGHKSEDGGKRIFKRAASGVKAVVYATLAFSSVTIASGSGSGGGSKGGSKSGTDGYTAQLMSAPGGQILVGLVGLAIVGAGGYLAYKGVAQKFTKRIKTEGTSGDTRKPVIVLGTVGYVAKGVALAAIGLLFVTAALQHDASESGGLDQALHTLQQQPFGRPLLIGVALGFGCYGVFCFFWARYLDRD